MDFDELMKSSESVVEVIDKETSYHITSMSGLNYDRIERMNKRATNGSMGEGVMQYTVAVCLCDDEGNRHDPEGKQYRKLDKWPLPILLRLFKAAADASGGNIEGEEGN